MDLKVTPYQTGCIYWLCDTIDKTKVNNPAVLRGSRPVVILNTVYSEFSPILVAPLRSAPGKSNEAHAKYFHVPVQTGTKLGWIDLMQIHPILPSQLGSFIGVISIELQEQIRHQLSALFGITATSIDMPSWIDSFPSEKSEDVPASEDAQISSDKAEAEPVSEHKEESPKCSEVTKKFRTGKTLRRVSDGVTYTSIGKLLNEIGLSRATYARALEKSTDLNHVVLNGETYQICKE